jgi:hypothetical protein
MRRFWSNTRETWDDMSDGQHQFIQAVVSLVKSIPQTGAVIQVRAAYGEAAFSNAPKLTLTTSSKNGKRIRGEDMTASNYWMKLAAGPSAIQKYQAPRAKQRRKKVFGGNGVPPTQEQRPSWRQAPQGLSRRSGALECSVSVSNNLTYPTYKLFNLAF